MNIEEVIVRLKEALSLHTDKEVADLFGLSSANYANRKKRGTLLPLIIEYGEKSGIDFNWLLTGIGTPKKTGDITTTILESKLSGLRFSLETECPDCLKKYGPANDGRLNSLDFEFIIPVVEMMGLLEKWLKENSFSLPPHKIELIMTYLYANLERAPDEKK